ncbi:MAG: DUF433 domain-containing protein [Myxococcales bacterium]|nr:DUF433 domain-containing protein [Myxococcales bacterium]
MAANASTLYRGRDPRELPNYSIAEAARYLRIPNSTLRAWALGMGATFKPVFVVPQKSPPALSFHNLVEAHVLNAIREHLPLAKIRPALKYVEKNLGIPRPLVNKVFQTDGVGLFVDHCCQLVDVTKQGQVAMREMLCDYLRRIEFDRAGLAARLYPFTRAHTADARQGDPWAVVFDPAISFGRLVVAGTGITTAAVGDRFVAGDTIDELARDFDLDPHVIEEAVRCESLLKAA